MLHAITRPFVVIGALALFIAILLGTSTQAIEFATNMSILVIDIARAILTALMEGVFGSLGAPVEPPPAQPTPGTGTGS